MLQFLSKIRVGSGYSTAVKLRLWVHIPTGAQLLFSSFSRFVSWRAQVWPSSRAYFWTKTILSSFDVFSYTSKTSHILQCSPHMVRIWIFSQLLCSDQESNSCQFSCTSLRELNSGCFTNWVITVIASYFYVTSSSHFQSKNSVDIRVFFIQLFIINFDLNSPYLVKIHKTCQQICHLGNTNSHFNIEVEQH